MFDQIIETFFELVKVDSPTGFELDMAKLMMKKLSILGIKSEMDDIGNVIASVPGDIKKETLFLCAHLDTVDPGRGIEPVVNKGRIYSKGNTILGADNKAAIAAILEVLKVLSSEGFKYNHPIDLVFTVGEEAGSRGALGLDCLRLRAKKGYTFDGSDGNIGDIEIAAPYYNKLEIWMTGKTSHAMDPELGTNVLPSLASAMTKINFGRISEKTLVNLGLVTVGTGINVIPGDVEVVGEVRSHDEKELEKVTMGIFDIFMEEVKNKEIGVETLVTRENNGYEFSKNDEFLKETKAKLGKIGLKPDLLKVWGCSDGNVFNQKGIKVLNIVDGGRYSHSEYEEVTVDELKKLTNVVKMLVS